MKDGYKHKTGYFGSGGELYVERLFDMIHIDNGHSRPDLITADKKFNPPLAIEVKSSGEPNKCDMNLGSLRYCIFNLDASGDSLMMQESEVEEVIMGYDPNKPSSGVVVYFDALRRVDGLAAKDLTHPFSSLRFKYGNHFIVPAGYVFASFVVGDMMRTPGNTLEESRRQVLERLVGTEIHGWDDTHRQGCDFQNMPIQDIKYFLTKDEGVLTKQGKLRVDSIRRLLPSIDDYITMTISGPNQTQVYVMATKKDVPLLQQLERAVRRRKKTVEGIIREREETLPLLDRATSSWQQCFNSILDSNAPTENIVMSLTDTYTPNELARLNRLKH